MNEPAYDAQVNILGSINLLQNCVRFKVKRVVYASSCAIYGAPIYVPIDEQHPIDPISPYGVSKYTVEKYLFAFGNTFGLSHCALRYSNVYGPRQNPGGEAGVVAIFTDLMLSGQQPNIYGNGKKTRSYVYVGDIVKANLAALDSKACGAFNVGTEEETTDQQVFDLISRYCSYNGKPRYCEERPGEVKRMCLNDEMASQVLGWTPAVSFEEGVRQTVTYYRDRE